MFGNNWLKDEARVEQIEVTEKFTGTYTAPALLISTPTGQKLVDINPGGAYTLMAEGLLDVEGGFGREHIMYIVEGGPYINKPATDDKNKLIRQPTYKDIDDDGWYWIEETLEDKAHFLNDKNALLDVITQVSYHKYKSEWQKLEHLATDKFNTPASISFHPKKDGDTLYGSSLRHFQAEFGNEKNRNESDLNNAPFLEESHHKSSRNHSYFQMKLGARLLALDKFTVMSELSLNATQFAELETNNPPANG